MTMKGRARHICISFHQKTTVFPQDVQRLYCETSGYHNTDRDDSQNSSHIDSSQSAASHGNAQLVL